MSQKVRINARVSQETLDKIDKLAKETKRSKSNCIDFILGKYFELIKSL